MYRNKQQPGKTMNLVTARCEAQVVCTFVPAATMNAPDGFPHCSGNRCLFVLCSWCFCCKRGFDRYLSRVNYTSTFPCIPFHERLFFNKLKTVNSRPLGTKDFVNELRN